MHAMKQDGNVEENCFNSSEEITPLELRHQRRLPRTAIEIWTDGNNSSSWLWEHLDFPDLPNPFRSLLLAERHQTFAARTKTLFPLPESFRDRLNIRRICGVRLPVSVHLLAAYECFTWFIAYPLISFVVFVYALFSKETELSGIAPYIGLLFYTWIIPSLLFPILTLSVKVPSILNADTSTVVIVCTVLFFLCWVCAPVFGIYAMVTISTSESVLRFGSYIFVAFGIPLFSGMVMLCIFWILSISRIPEALFGKQYNLILSGITGSILVASIIHQHVVEELVWFPYLSIVGLTVGIAWITSICCIPIAVGMGMDSSNPNALPLATVLGIVAIATDVSAYYTSMIDYTQTTEELVANDVVYAGGVLCYISISLPLLLWAGAC